MNVVYTEKSPNNIDFGFSSAFALLFWSIWGGFILHMMMSNYLAVLMRPTFGKPIDTIDDFIGLGHFKTY